MGLLDEAIREHLELKRLRGADPHEIARAEQEALEPIFPDEPAETAAAGEPVAQGADFANVGQETAELDMQAVLDADSDHASAPEPDSASAAPPARAAPSDQHGEHDSMEWEMPAGAERRTPPEEVPGQERMSFE